MAFKIALIFVVACFAQGYSWQIMGRLPAPCRPIPEFAEEITHNFEEVMNGIDDMRETISVAAADAYAKRADPEVIIACVKAQRDSYMALGKRMSELVQKASEEMAKELGDKYEEFDKKTREPMRKIGETMKTLPEKVWVLIQNGEFGKAVAVVRQSRRIVQQNAMIIARAVRELRQEMPEAAEKAEKLVNEIRDEARKGVLAIEKAFRECVEAGGPKNPVEVEVEESEN